MLTHPLLKLSAPLSSPAPTFDVGRDAVVCFVTPRFGADGWRLRPVPVPLGDVASPEPVIETFHMRSANLPDACIRHQIYERERRRTMQCAGTAGACAPLRSDPSRRT